MKDGKLQVHFGPTHYHLHAVCIAAKNPEFDSSNDRVTQVITENDKRSFKEPQNAQFTTNLNCNEQADVAIFECYLARSLHEPPILVFEIVVSIMS